MAGSCPSYMKDCRTTAPIAIHVSKKSPLPVAAGRAFGLLPPAPHEVGTGRH
jgi:hypothetical protein